MPICGSSHLDGHAQDAHSQTPLLKRSLHTPATASNRLLLLFQNWWMWEIVSAVTAVLAIVVIIIILLLFDQRSLPDWPYVFTVHLSTSLIQLIAERLRRLTQSSPSSQH